MKQQVFNYFKIRARVLGINIANTFNLETAYPAENWANIFSTLLYTASYILFLNIIFGNVKSLAGYSLNDMLFFSLIGQASFHMLYTWSFDNMENLIESVHQGEMDLLLTKPLPTLFYVSTRQFSLVRLVRDAFLPMAMISLLINWPALDLSFGRILAGLVIFICGQWAMHVLQFLLVLPAFWNGQSQALLRICYVFTNPDIPLQGLTKFWRVLLTTVLPISLPVAASVSVMLGRSNASFMVSWSLILTATATLVRFLAWRKALGAYNSASS